MKKEREILSKKLYELFQAENDALVAKAMQRLQTEGAPVYSQRYYQGIRDLKQQGKKKERKYFFFGPKAVSKAAIVVLMLWVGAISGITVYGINRHSAPTVFIQQEGMLLTYQLEPEVIESLPKTIETAYEPTWMPEAYELKRTTEMKMMNYSCYENKGQEKEILLIQSVLTGVVHTYDTEGITVQETEISGYPAYYYEKNDFITLLWSDEEYHFDLTVPKEVGKDIFKIAKSLKPMVQEEKAE